MRINNSGHYEYCRWGNKTDRTQTPHIKAVTAQQYFQQHMQPLRQQLLAGDSLPGCSSCASMEQHHKVSGRQKQLLKIGVRLEQFEKTLASSPWVPIFSNDQFDQLPQDWQIDLGNYCNSGCIFCSPHSSSKLATEFQQLGLIDKLPTANWTDQTELVEKFIHTLEQSPHIQYLHFIGGETLITPAFTTILKALIQAGLHRTATIGFTTNLTVWDHDVTDLLCEFHSVNLGASIETFDAVNDYVRWPSQIHTVNANLDKWFELAQQQHWLMQLRTTPTVFTIDSLLTVYDWAWDRGVCVESCNFLHNPEFMRPSVLPSSMRHTVIARMQSWLDNHKVSGDTVVNIRNPNTSQLQNYQDLKSYVAYLTDQPDESFRLLDLVQFIKRLESSRGNSILTYLPHYEELFRSAGY